MSEFVGPHPDNIIHVRFDPKIDQLVKQELKQEPESKEPEDEIKVRLIITNPVRTIPGLEGKFSSKTIQIIMELETNIMRELSKRSLKAGERRVQQEADEQDKLEEWRGQPIKARPVLVLLPPFLIPGESAWTKWFRVLRESQVIQFPKRLLNRVVNSAS